VYPVYIQITALIVVPIIIWRLWIKYKRIRWMLGKDDVSNKGRN
jgi:hypothetical protein